MEGGVSEEAPTLSEVVRRLDDVVREVREMRREMSEERKDFQLRFLPRAEFDLSQQSDAIQVRGLEGEVHNIKKRLDTTEDRRRQDRALLLGSLAFPLLVILLGALLLTGRMS